MKAPAIAINIALAVLALFTLFPLAWMVSASLMVPGEASSFPPPLLPREPTLANYRELFANAGIGRQIMNSLIVAIGATILSLTFNLAAGYAFNQWDDLSFDWWHIVVLGLSLPLAAAVGDLAESAMKRARHIKDASELIPGHGGVLDRLDSILFTFPTMYLFVEFVVSR